MALIPFTIIHNRTDLGFKDRPNDFTLLVYDDLKKYGKSTSEIDSLLHIV